MLTFVFRRKLRTGYDHVRSYDIAMHKKVIDDEAMYDPRARGWR
jgi:hypothetical protein